jgi:hypothetical protein
MTNNISELQKDSVKDFELKPNRSWTSLAGVNINFLESWTLNIEAYYKYVFSRYYRINMVNLWQTGAEQVYYFNGSGQVIGADLMLHKRAGPYIDGWLAYTFTHARYQDPGFGQTSGQNRYRADPYYPAFHRFHNLNLVLNIKPQNKFHIYVRYGLASGQPKPIAGEIDYYPVSVLEEDSDGNITAKDGGYYIQKFKRESYYSDDSRTTFSMPFDVKFSWFFFNKKGRTTGEFYVAVENIASLFYQSQANTSFNQYTGKEDTGSTAAVYELPIPVPSVGIKWSF